MASWIYLLLDPDTEAVRYVGQSREPIVRLHNHVANAFNPLHMWDLAPCGNWVRGLAVGAKGIPTLLLAEFVDDGDAHAAEQRWIKGLTAEGADLLNVSASGRWDRMSITARAGHRKRIGAAKRIEWEARRRDGKATLSTETRQRMSEAAKRRWARERAKVAL